MSLEITPIVISASALALAGLTFYFNRINSTKVDTEKIEGRLTKVETTLGSIESNLKTKGDYIDDLLKVCERVKALEVKNDLVWGAIEKTMVDILHHPTEYVRDALLEKLASKTITLVELEELAEILKCVIRERKAKEESIAAALLLARTQQIIFDTVGIKEMLNNCP